jgi:hypothetical protein
MTLGCDRGPYSQARRDFAFREFTSCSMLKSPSRESAIPGSDDTRPSEKDDPDRIGVSGLRAIDTSHLSFPENISSMVRILCHVPF